MNKDNLGDRMKNYENVSRHSLIRRMPVILRLDGKAFHTWTVGLNRPYDTNMMSWMSSTLQYLVDEIQGAVFGYTQSDEISILLRDYDKLNSDAWFSNGLQKMVSVAASMATAHFNNRVAKAGLNKKLALFDCRAFNLPKEEVTNYFLWRQNDCTRNSIQSLGQAKLGHKKCQNLNNSKVMDELMLLDEPVNWNDMPTAFKRGICYIRDSDALDLDPPIFSQQRDYVERHVYIPSEE